ncbi:Csu type fimbrial protein [Limibacillus halophilus]|uniref:Spore coat protein U-like protein n=1 Tax=Limibacillus halophilus TaxID=1579333 RepID=A0A839SY02_9PROT|nr:spore coat U domain-containing protein [Limibacillus halophilus]MBB3066504.1 spore coat protein U-like protein [Limibacillus halophilus]
MNANYKFAVVGAVGFLAAVGNAEAAGELRGNMDVLLDIGTGCAVNVDTSGGENQWGTVDFGSQASLSNIIDAESSGTTSANQLEMTCNTGLPYAIGIDLGQNQSGANTRRMSGVVSGEFVAYELYQDAAHTQVWGQIGTAGELQSTGTGAAQEYVVHGRIPSGQTTPSAGSYKDTVRVTVRW